MPAAAAARPRAGLTTRDRITDWVGEIWSRMLGVDRIGPQGNFFDLGGHFLLATRLAARLSDELQVPLSRRPLRTRAKWLRLDGRGPAGVQDIRVPCDLTGPGPGAGEAEDAAPAGGDESGGGGEQAEPQTTGLPKTGLAGQGEHRLVERLLEAGAVGCNLGYR